MFTWLYKLLGAMLGFFGDKLGGYAIALLLYALIFKLVFSPFSIKQQKNQIAMAKLAPKIDLIKAKYKGRTDQKTMQKQQEEIMELQRNEGYSPLSGCLPLLIQLPLIMLLYTVINNPLSYIAKTNDAAADKDQSTVILEVYKGITDSEEIDNLTSVKGKEIEIINEINKYVNNYDGRFGTDSKYATKEGRIEHIESLGLDYDSIPDFYIGKVNLAEKPSLSPDSISLLCLIPFIAAGAQWVSMWLTRKFNGNNQMMMQDSQTQASMKLMDFIFPAMTLFMAFNFSAMLGLYWIYQTLLGLLQSFILAKAMPLPKFTEEELKNIQKARKEAEKAQKEAAKSQPKYRSLHYIDDEDYDILPDAPKSESSNSKPIDGDMPEIKD